MVNGKELPGKIMKSDEARSLYEAIVRKNQDPALLEWMGSGLFKTSVFPVPAGESHRRAPLFANLSHLTRCVRLLIASHHRSVYRTTDREI